MTRAETPTAAAAPRRAGLPRRALLPAPIALSAATLLVPLLANPARAQAGYPTKPVRVVVPFGPGGIADTSLRIAAERLTGELGQQVVVENQPGAGGITAASNALKAPADGHTLALLTNGTAISVPLFKKLPFDPLADFVPVSSVAFFDFVVVTNARSALRTMADVVAAARKDPGGLKVGTINIGSSQNLSAELLKSTAGIDVTIVPYRQTPDLLVGALRGDVDLMIDNYAAVKAAVDDGRARVVATTGTARSPALPDVPTVQEGGVQGFEVTSWNGVFAPAGTPAEAIDAMNRALRTVLAVPEVKQRMLDLGIEAKASTPEELRGRLRADIAKWGEVIAKAGIERQ